jgi:hypothetical protein
MSPTLSRQLLVIDRALYRKFVSNRHLIIVTFYYARITWIGRADYFSLDSTKSKKPTYRKWPKSIHNSAVDLHRHVVVLLKLFKDNYG